MACGPRKRMKVATTLSWGGHSWLRAGFPAGSLVGPSTERWCCFSRDRQGAVVLSGATSPQ